MIRVGNEVEFGSGRVAVMFESMGLYLVEMDKSYPIGFEFTDEEDWFYHQTGRSVLLKFSHEAEVHYLYNTLNSVTAKNRSIEYGDTTLTFNGKHWKKSVDSFKYAIKVWINKKIELLNILLEEGLEDKDFYKDDIV